MIKHIVMWKLKDEAEGNSKDENAKIIKNSLEDLKGKIVSREEIMNYLWESENFIDDNTLTVNMTRLRGKLEELGIKDSIETKRGQGYILK